MKSSHGEKLRQEIQKGGIIPFIGIYDVFSASIAAGHYDALFLSGFGFAASYYGLPDRGFIAWSDLVAFVQRVRTILPRHLLLVDIDDGYGDAEVAGHVVCLLESAGASGVVLEDQKRPRQCGHLHGKQILELDDYLAKLRKVLAARRTLVVVARTDAADPDERLARVRAFEKEGADAVLVEGISSLHEIHAVRAAVRCPLLFNAISGGKSPNLSLTQLKNAGVSMVNYSTPCLFAAQTALVQAMELLQQKDGLLPTRAEGGIGVADCEAILQANLARRAERGA